LTLFSKEDKILIKSLQECKGYDVWQFIAELPDKGWTKNSINRLLVTLRKFKQSMLTGSVTGNFRHIR